MQMPNRTRTRMGAIAAALSFAVAMAGLKGAIPVEFAFLGLTLFVSFLALIALLPWWTRRKILARRDAVERGQMLVLLAAELRDEETATLESMVRSGGPAGEAAALILQGRVEHLRRSSEPTT